MQSGCVAKKFSTKSLEDFSAFSDFVGGEAISVIHFEAPKCKQCGETECLLIQVYCGETELSASQSVIHRTIYVYGCINSICQTLRLCYTALRVKITSKKPEIKKKQIENDWGMGTEEKLSEVKEETENMKTYVIKSPCLAKCTPIYFYENEYDTTPNSDDDDADEMEVSALSQYMHSDYHDAREVINYNRGGVPIIDNNRNLTRINSLKCAHCGSSMIYEAQLFPNINNFLGKGSDWVFSFDNLLIYTCEQSCGDVREETIIMEGGNQQ